ncbi:MAG: hypothetical protein LAO20_17450 [Acidobacteriia bacterium]|nr:hypothetical protein [Terriglobia bacterium]
MIHKAKDLSPEQKVALERLLGRAISDREDISIRVLQPPPGVSPARRQEILEGLKTYFAEVDSQRKPVSGEQADKVIDEAIRSSRPAYRPHD